MFKGIKIVQTTNEVISDKSGISYQLRGLDNAEEIALKNSILVQSSSIERHINNIIWSCIISNSAGYKTREEFENNALESDRTLLLYSIYLVTYGPTETVPCNCEHCSNTGQKVVVKLNELYHSNSNNEDGKGYVKDQVINITDELIPGTTLVIKDVTIHDVIATSDITEKEDNDLYFNYIKEIKTKDLETDEDISTDDKYDILSVYQKLPVRIKKKIETVVRDNFGKYEPEFYFKYICDKCSKENKINMDVTQRFFRLVLRLEN